MAESDRLLPLYSTSGPELPAEFSLGGVRIHALTEVDCVRNVVDSCRAGRGGWVITPNVDFLERSRRDPGFRAILRAASLSVPDGMPLVWAARIAGEPVRKRVAGSDLISSLCAEAAARGLSIFLLGGNEGTAEAAAAVLSERHPQLRIAGCLCPPFGFETEERELVRIKTALNATKPDLVFVGLGSPKSERLIASLQLTDRRSLSSTWWIGVGVSFRFLCGEIERAPLALQKLGLEWTHRLWKEPRRLAGRYLLRDLPFAAMLLLRALARRARRSAAA
jgi:N-acetylglucosaminyldiphosphoundecaprenol N-acetyl-beta-D-mannosaminyltransferase